MAIRRVPNHAPRALSRPPASPCRRRRGLRSTRASGCTRVEVQLPSWSLKFERPRSSRTKRCRRPPFISLCMYMYFIVDEVRAAATLPVKTVQSCSLYLCSRFLAERCVPGFLINDLFLISCRTLCFQFLAERSGFLLNAPTPPGREV